MNVGRWMAGRVHLSASDRDLIRFIRDRIKPESRGRADRQVRHDIYREALKAHHHGQELAGHFRLNIPAPGQGVESDY